MIEEYNLTEVSEVLIENVIFGAENSSSSQTDNVKKKLFSIRHRINFWYSQYPLCNRKKTSVKHIQITLLKFILQW